MLWFISLQSCKVISESVVCVDNSKLYLFGTSCMMIYYIILTIVNFQVNNNHLYSLHRKTYKAQCKKYQCVYTVHYSTHLVKKKHTKCYIKKCV